MTEQYSKTGLLPPVLNELNDFAGPHGPAYVQVYDNDKTAPGWGEKMFMPKYNKRAFSVRRAQAVYERYQAPFALVMRSVSMVCIDIDGKNDGISSARGLVLPPTLAETSKSGNGYHLFYLVEDDWHPALGFAKLRDKIGFMQGVDLRGTGCVYHYPQQQWNHRPPVFLPEHVLDKITARSNNLDESIQRIKTVLSSNDELEILMMQEHVASRLTAPIPQGKRNTTLFALGAEMSQAQVPGWEQQILDRGLEVGLDQAEVEKIIANVRRYG
jgi:hypothetical protein